MRTHYLGNIPPTLVLVALAIAACAGQPQPPSEARIVKDATLAARIDNAANEAFASIEMAGMSVAVAEQGQPVFASGYGYADLETRSPSGLDTVYRLGSIGKTFTAAALLNLAREGQLDLDDPVARHIGDLPNHLGDVTTRHLLSHTAGLSEHVIGPLLEETGGVGYTRDQVRALAFAEPLVFDPGTDWSYSNVGYMLAGDVVTGASGQTYAEYVSTEVLEPLELTATVYCPNEPPQGTTHAVGYDVLDGSWERAKRLGRAPGLMATQPINMDIVFAAGAWCSTVVDLVRWPHLLSTELVGHSRFTEMGTPVTLADGTHRGYGLGLEIRNYGEHRALAHGGIINGFVSMVAIFPADEITVALLVNTLLSEADSEELLNRLLGAVFDEPSSRWGDPYIHGQAS